MARYFGKPIWCGVCTDGMQAVRFWSAYNGKDNKRMLARLDDCAGWYFPNGYEVICERVMASKRFEVWDRILAPLELIAERFISKPDTHDPYRGVNDEDLWYYYHQEECEEDFDETEPLYSDIPF